MTGYTRQSSYTDGDTIQASDSNSEFDQLLAVFDSTAGHAHDGSPNEGPVISLIGDAGSSTPLNKLAVDTDNDRFSFYVDVASASTEQIRVEDGVVYPATDNDIDLGTPIFMFKDGYFQGTLNAIITSTAAITAPDGTAAALITTGDGVFTIYSAVLDTADINGGTIDGTVIGGTTPAAGSFTTLAASTSITGTLATAAQPNVTSVGTLTSLAVSGDVSFDGGNATFGDNDKAIFGAGSDLQIYHDGSNSRIVDTGTGDMSIEGANVRFRSTNGDYYAYFTSNAETSLYYNNAVKLATTSTGIDVTGQLQADSGQFDGTVNIDGTVTADGLVVESTSPTILNTTGTDGTTIGTLYFSNTQGGSSGNHAGIRGVRTTSAAGAMEFYTKDGGGQFERMQIASNGDISFYEDTGTTPKFFWDASAESLGIGNSAPATGLDVTTTNYTYSGTTYDIYGIIGTTGGGVRLGADSTNDDSVIGTTGNGNMQFVTYDGSAWDSRMTLSSTGNVGIGTSSPSTTFVVKSPSAAGQLRIDSDAGAGRIHSNGDLQFYTNSTDYSIQFKAPNDGSEHMRIDSSGRVGIGTSSPSNVLTVGDDASITVGKQWGIDFKDDGFGKAQAFINAEGRYTGNYNTDLVFGTIGTSGDATERMRIDSSGNVGIGVVPTQKLQVDGDIRIGDTAVGSGDNEQYNITTGGQLRIKANDGASDISFTALTLASGSSGGAAASSSLIAFEVNDSERMRIDSSGNLLVGKTSVSSTGGVEIQPNVSGLGFGRVEIDSAYNGTALSLQFKYLGTSVGSIAQTTTSTSYNTSSDYRLKEDVQPMTGASDRVQSLKPCNFAWKADGTRVDGFLAHEAQAVVPEAVTGEKDGEEMQAIDQSKLVPLLTAALQEALTKIDALETRITALEG